MSMLPYMHVCANICIYALICAYMHSFICICYLHCLRGFLRCTTTLDTLMYIHADATIFLHLRQESRISFQDLENAYIGTLR